MWETSETKLGTLKYIIGHFKSTIQNTVCLISYSPTHFWAENSLLRYVSEDKTEEFHTGRRSSRRSRRKSEKGGSPAHYALVPTLQMDMLPPDSLATPTSETSSVYLVRQLHNYSRLSDAAWSDLHTLFIMFQTFDRSSVLSRSKKNKLRGETSILVKFFSPSNYIY